VNGVVSSFDADTLERIAGLAPAWPRWLNAWDLFPATIGRAVELGCRAIAVDFHAIEPGSLAAARAAGLEIAAFTVRRRATFGRLQRLGVIAACVEAAALDG
jgi:glycerophosphoryl diester phosphodiesterase